ncbi:immunoglobulin-like domain-containing protein [Metabacillus fastidiosus]|uniref:immunoglobulin-like domain-containing protein n=1 Tax=Metabacillus fastidiosus TaxID=1458 RepID=UPI003D2D6A01
MIRKWQSIVFLTLVCFLLSACQTPSDRKDVETNTEAEAKIQTIPTSKNGLKLLRKEADTLTSEDSLEMIIQNNSSIDYTYGKAFHIEKRSKNTWYAVADDMRFEAIALSIPANTSQTELISLKELKNFKIELNPGEYRIVKSFSPSEQTSSEEDTILLAVPFKVK